MRLDFSHTRIIIRPGTTNMLASRDQLLEIIKNIMKDDPFSGAVFLFCNRKRNILKMIWWDRTGFRGGGIGSFPGCPVRSLYLCVQQADRCI